MSRNKHLNDSTQQKLADLEKEIGVASVALQEAKAFGDLRENSEYEAALATFESLMLLLSECKAYLDEPIIVPLDNNLVQDGIKVGLTMYGPFEIKPNNLPKDVPIALKGVFIIGGCVPFHNITTDFTIDANAPLYKELIGKVIGSRFDWSMDRAFYVVETFLVKEEAEVGFEKY